jgi:hypothetical protein
LPAAKHPEPDHADFSREARSTWARLIQKIFEADPLLAPAAAACASSPLLPIPASSSVSCGIVKAGTAKPKILSNRERHPVRL